jgi:hypothetical protein
MRKVEQRNGLAKLERIANLIKVSPIAIIVCYKMKATSTLRAINNFLGHLVHFKMKVI